jgi:hypothetical protein
LIFARVRLLRFDAIRIAPFNPANIHSHPVFRHSMLNCLIISTPMLPFRMNSPHLACPEQSRRARRNFAAHESQVTDHEARFFILPLFSSTCAHLRPGKNVSPVVSTASTLLRPKHPGWGSTLSALFLSRFAFALILPRHRRH